MAKTYVSTVKYLITVDFEIQGIVDKHDIIGAVFGQLEGLLGEDMDLKELQQSGKIGRIEVNSEIKMGKIVGTLLAPSSMDMVKTTMLAASIESVDKVGPYESRFSVEKIDDTRAEKRNALQERAKQLLQKFTSELPDSHEMAQGIVHNKRSAELKEFGPDKLPCGPEMETSSEIIVVEGRADVINLLRNSIKNGVAMDGAKIPPSILDLSRQKQVTVFVDGDRGGEMIARQFLQMASVEFVAKAPDGKEVEELTKKEILLSLSKKIPAGSFKFGRGRTSPREFEPRERSYRPRSTGHSSYGRDRTPRERGRPPIGRGRPPRGRPPLGRERPAGPGMDRSYGSRPRPGFDSRPKPFNDFGPSPSRSFPRNDSIAPKANPEPLKSNASPEELKKFGPVMQELQNSLKAKFLDGKNTAIKEASVRDMLYEMGKTPNAKAVVFDGIVTKRLVDAAQQNNFDYLVGVKKGKIETPEKVKVVTIA